MDETTATPTDAEDPPFGVMRQHQIFTAGLVGDEPDIPIAFEELEKKAREVMRPGILLPDDARRALDEGAAGVVVSNHGGRQVDGSIGALDALVKVVEAVGSRTNVLFDSGIRRGPDVCKAIALGARCVLLGRPYCYGLGIAGEKGVDAVVRNLLSDVDLTLGLSGGTSMADLRELVSPALSPL
jgi:isopentenyl diphosphate isomerase/L-lactate dehydrogenase-like FMN-dependent dehydrogenase